MGRDADEPRPEMIAIEDLLDPVPGDAPHGIDLRNPAYHRALSNLRTVWQRVRQREQRADPDTRADWLEVETQARVIVTQLSKDLEVAAWLSEALTRTTGFAGLAAAGDCLIGMVERHWTELYPAPFPDDAKDADPVRLKQLSEDARLEPINRLGGTDGRLLAPIGAHVLFILSDGTAFLAEDCRSSRSWSARTPEERTEFMRKLSPEGRARREASAGHRMWDQVKDEVRANFSDAMNELRGDVEAALTAWHALQTLLDAKLGEGRFSARPLIALLEDVSRTVAELAPPPVSEAGDTVDAPRTSEPEAAANARKALMPGQIDSREAALSQLAEIAAFFRRTEPHTSVAYMVEQVVRRARLSWPEWIAEAVPDNNQREAILARLGLPSVTPPG
jgi:type VI secretion system protein ImpA